MTIIINGCFDLFHDGHRHLISKAYELASHYGHLVILMNSDESVAKLKGPGRPIDPIKVRLSNIDSYLQILKQEYRDYAPACSKIIFHTEEELIDYIDHYQPKMLVKGNDRPDTRTIVGYGKYPILIIPRLTDPQGNEISTTTRITNLAKK